METTSPTIINTVAAFFQAGGYFMYIIAVVWGTGIAICLERFIKLYFKLDVDGGSFWNEVQRYLLSNDHQGAIRICSATSAALPRILKAGIQRFKQGTKQIAGAIDAATFEVLPKIETRMAYLGVIASIATLFGLLGTIQGLIESFQAVASADPAQKAELLATGISKAMNTTYLGLLAAISIMIIHSILAARAEKIKGDVDEFSHKLLDFFGNSEKGSEA